jgi:hypothetical protein
MGRRGRGCEGGGRDEESADQPGGCRGAQRHDS